MPSSNKSKEGGNSFWEHRRTIAVIVVFGLAAILWARFSSTQNPESSSTSESNPSLMLNTTDTVPSSSSNNLQSGEVAPDITFIGERDHLTGIIGALIYGHIDAQCVRINWARGAYSGNQTNPEFKPDDPVITYGYEALARLGVDPSDVSADKPIYVAKGTNIIVADSMGNTIFNNLNIGNEVCDAVN